MPLRCFLRGLYGAAMTLMKMGSYREALEKMEELCSYQRGEASLEHSFIDPWAYLPSLWYRVHGPAGCLERLLRLKQKHLIMDPTVRIPWIMTAALAMFSTGRAKRFRIVEVETAFCAGITADALFKHLLSSPIALGKIVSASVRTGWLPIRIFSRLLSLC